jgi:hypothetical protein
MSADESAELLGSAAYKAVFNKVMTGTELGALSDEERALLAEVRELTNTPAPGLPLPTQHDRTRSEQA